MHSNSRSTTRPRFLILPVSLLFTLVVSACASAAPQSTQKPIKVGLVTDKAGLDDKGFNHLAAIGLARAASSGNVCSALTCQGTLGVQGDVTESHDDSDYVPNLTYYATRGYELVIAVNFRMGQAIGSVSGQYPNIHFAIIDGVGTDSIGKDLQHANVVGLLFREQDAGALVGTIAGVLERNNAGVKKQHTIGSVGSIKVSVIDHYIAGYQWAAKQVDPAVKTLNAYSDSFSDPSKCAGIAEGQISQGADILFQAAGNCGTGVLTQAGKDGVWSIGVDTDEKDIDKSVIASAVKRVDVATFAVITDVKNNNFKDGIKMFGLANDGVGYAPGNIALPSNVLSALQDMTKKIKSGSVTVSDTVAQN